MLDQKKIDTKSLEGRKFRFVVSSAEDAARTIRERLGETARVLSVKQVNGKGLTKFLSSPQLEIVVEVPKKDPEVIEKKEPEADHYDFKVAQSSSTPYGDLAQQASVSSKPKKSVENLLKDAGFDQSFFETLKIHSNWDDLCKLPVPKALSEFTRYLKSKLPSQQTHELSSKICFFGLPGSGTTTALCKYLAREVFLNNKEAQVLKLENETPNFDNALSVYCDTLGVEVLRDNIDLDKISPKKTLVVDVQGSIYYENEEWFTTKKSLDSLGIDTRILVINAAYDKQVIQNSFLLGERMGANFVVFTHMDEVVTLGKLWPYVINAKIPVLFVSKGQNVAGDISMDIFNEFVHKTFPSPVLS